MKKLLTVLFSLAMIISLTGCKKEPVNDDPANEEYKGTVMLYTSIGEEPSLALKEAFEKKYPNVTLEYYAATSGKCVTKLSTEFEAGQVACDVCWLAEPSSMLKLMKDDRLMQYVSPNAKYVDDQFKDPDGYYTGARILIMGLAYSTVATEDAKVPYNWDGVIDSEFDNQIILTDPNSSGSTKALVYALVHSEKYGWEYFEKLAALNPGFQSSANATNQELAAGSYKVAFGVEHTTWGLMAEGSPLGWHATEDTIAVACPIAIPNGCPNEELAKLLYDFILDPQGGQKVLPSFFVTPIVDGVELIDGMKSAKEITSTALKVDWVDLANTSDDLLARFNALFNR